MHLVEPIDTLPDVRYWSKVLCCTIPTHLNDLEVKVQLVSAPFDLSHVTRKPVFGVFDQVRLALASLEILDLASIGIILSK